MLDFDIWEYQFLIKFLYAFDPLSISQFGILQAIFLKNVKALKLLTSVLKLWHIKLPQIGSDSSSVLTTLTDLLWLPKMEHF